jgi:hypothetical protein
MGILGRFDSLTPISRISFMKGHFLLLLAGVLLVGVAIVTAQDPVPQQTSPPPLAESSAIQELPYFQAPEPAKVESLESLVKRLKVIQEEKQKLNMAEQALIANIRKVIQERRNEIQKIEEMLNEGLSDPQREKSSKVETFMVPGYLR